MLSAIYKNVQMPSVHIARKKRNITDYFVRTHANLQKPFIAIFAKREKNDTEVQPTHFKMYVFTYRATEKYVCVQ